MRSPRGVLVLAALLCPPALRAQGWNDSATTALVQRAVGRRAAPQGESGLKDFQARAHGFVFFLGQLGEGLTDPPRLIKADQLALEVYWKAPGASKQHIIGWRDRADLPTDIQYHRDHLGIVMGGFGDRIQVGEGTEVRGVPHPLAPAGPTLYDFALHDSLTIEIPQRAVRVYQVLVRPKDFTAPRIVGSLFLDADDAALVRFSFKFTRSAYLDRSLEDIAVVLDNGLWDGRYWLPRRQEIEIRRRSEWLDLPARGIIRGRWEIGEYAFNVGLTDAQFRGPEITAAPRAARDTFPWPTTLDVEIARTVDDRRLNVNELHAAVAELASGRALSGLPSVRLGAASLSDLLHVNRVEGLTPGVGWVLRPGDGAIDLQLAFSYGLDDRRGKGRIVVSRDAGPLRVILRAAREVRDVGDEPIIAPAINSLLAQEAGTDHGDYVEADRLEGTLRYRMSERGGVSLTLGVEDTRSLGVVATPVRGTYRQNPALGGGRFRFGRLRVERSGRMLASARDVSLEAILEAGAGDTSRYVRGEANARLGVPLGATDLRVRAWGAWASSEVPAHRTVLWGGRGPAICDETLGRCGGRYGAAATVEWRFRVPVPPGRLGALFSTGREAVVAPFIGSAWVAGTVGGAPWLGTDGVMPVGGIVVEWLHQLLRTELGVELKTGRVGFTVDLNRALWPIL